MLTNIMKSAAACALAVSLSGQAAAAFETHEVLIVDGAYFPSLIYADHGDLLLFVNSSSDIHEVKAVDDTWTSGVVNIGDTFTLELVGSIQRQFTATAATEGVAGAEGDLLLEQVGEVVWANGDVNVNATDDGTLSTGTQ